MARINNYRSLTVIALALAVTGAFAGCDSADKKNATIKQEMRDQWNAARMGVVYQVAKQQYEAGDYDKCKETLAQALATNYPFPPLYTLAGKLAIEKGNLQDASDNFKVAMQLDANNPEPYYLMGVVFQRWQNPQSAHDYYKLAWDKKPNEASYLLAVVEMKITLGQVDEARKLLEDKLVYFEQTGAVRVALARICAIKGDNEAASKYYRDAVVLLPDDIALRQSYAESLFFAGKFADALPVLEELRTHDNVPDMENLQLILGRTYLNLRRSRDARNCLLDLTQAHPNNMLAYLTLAKAYLQDNDAIQAASTAQRVLRQEPENVQAYIVIALAQQKQRKWNDAQLTLQNAARLDPRNTTVMCMQGISARKLGDAASAHDYFEKAAALNPNDPWAQELLATGRSGEDGGQGR